jgi:MFS family permease
MNRNESVEPPALVPGEPSAGALSRATTKAAWRLIPFLLLLYVLAFLDRANVGFAKQALQRDTGLTEAAYALGAGLFFVGYAVFEVPSNLMLHRFGARLWLSRIMVTWGLVSAAMAWARTDTMFYALRFLLGVAEAGFFPGVILYLTYWFPSAARGRMLGLFYFGAPIALTLGGPLSGLLLELEGVFELKGWQWMFLVEGLAASVVGVWAFFYLNNRPAEARWLTAAERQALEAGIEADGHPPSHPGSDRLLRALTQPRLLHLGLIYALIQMSVYGVTFYLPSQVARLLGRDTGLLVGLVSAVPPLCALFGAYYVPRLSRGPERRRWVGGACLAATGGAIALSASDNPVVALLALCVAWAGFIGVQPVFWTVPTDELRGVAAAGGIALINSCGAVGGFLAPNLKTWTEQALSSASAGYALLALTTVLGALLFGLLPRTPPGRVRADTR